MATQLNTEEISAILQEKIKQLDIPSSPVSEGKVVSVKDGVVEIYGLKHVMSGELLTLAHNTQALALNLEEDSVSAVLLNNQNEIYEGQTVAASKRMLEVPVGDALLGRVVNALGEPLDGLGEIDTPHSSLIEKIAPGVITRESVSEPLETGIKAIDTMTPIGRGQRELIIGDRQTGKTTIAIDTIINQKKKGVRCIYVAIGQKDSSVASIIQILKDYDVLDNTTIVVAGASENAAMQYIAPFSGCAIGEYYRDRGEDALIVYDDLTKHAIAYRQLSLLLRRPPGREAFPGDIFYLHSRLLERAARVNADYVEKQTHGQVTGQTGSLTALPIIETQAGDVSAFIPTNVISITDGQIFLETKLFNSGIKPAMNTGLSVSRVGGAAQKKIIKKLGGGTRITLAQFRELEAFSQFSQELDEETKKRLDKGLRTVELMKQGSNAPLSTAEVACILMIVDEDLFKDIPVNKVIDAERELLINLRTHHKDLLTAIEKNPVYEDYYVDKLKEIVESLMPVFSE
jgi:F-type H+-transporting ATPase subunit alpha